VSENSRAAQDRREEMAGEAAEAGESVDSSMQANDAQTFSPGDLGPHASFQTQPNSDESEKSDQDKQPGPQGPPGRQ